MACSNYYIVNTFLEDDIPQNMDTDKGGSYTLYIDMMSASFSFCYRHGNLVCHHIQLSLVLAQKGVILLALVVVLVYVCVMGFEYVHP